MKEYNLNKEIYFNGKYIENINYKIIADNKEAAIEWAKIDGWIQLKSNDKFTIKEV